jgi:hypothetical protein
MDLAWFMIVAVVPVLAWQYARKKAPQHTWLAIGAAFGFVILTFCDGAASLLYTGDPLMAFIGYGVLYFGWLHWSPGPLLGNTPEGVAYYYTLLRLSIFWAVIYGLIGHIIDRLRLKRESKKNEL